ncbi:ABC transporter permease subunit [Amycolatopsis endophytica]|uniref:ABC-type dipeptide/oligopeptide/nickel transport system permease subunit n=1 Tax=Amycolatopsis endophytica TaxID=860233 RepID=A0A853BD69_9PSEU|nr:ABC transporter permease subunit [Amycolatopsis endophytica]NYI93368.1 ABC-type dipeptide/oligopeptide/nickel transport system permease subunit [Amycolatopsis endophytica]
MTRRRRAGVAGAVLLLALIVCGPLIAAHPATAPVAPAFSPPGTGGPLGTDQLGRDVLARLLHGSLPLLLTSVLGAVLGTALGALAGLSGALAAIRHPRIEPLVTRPLDVLAAVPPILVLLLVLTALPSRTGLVLAVVLSGLPLSARVARAAADQVTGRAHVEAALARGESWWWLLGREVLPLVGGTLLADLGLRFVTAVYLVAAAGFLGLGTGDSDWGLMIVEALPGAALQPWALLAPMIGVALLAVTANLLADGAGARARGVLA